MARTVFYRTAGSSDAYTAYTGDVPFTIPGLTPGSYEVHDGLASVTRTVTAPAPTPTPTPGTSLINDTFSSPDGTSLTARAAEKGGTWRIQPGLTGGGTALIASGRAYAPENQVWQLPTAIPADCYAEIDLISLYALPSGSSESARQGITFRASLTAATFYHVRQNFSKPGTTIVNGSCDLLVWNNGTPLALHTFSGITSSEGTRRLRIEARNVSGTVVIDAFIGSTKVGSFTHTGANIITADGAVGFRSNIGGTFVNSATQGFHFDNLVAGAL